MMPLRTSPRVGYFAKLAIAVMFAMTLLSGCDRADDPRQDSAGGTEEPQKGARLMSINVTSTVFDSGGQIPRQFTGDGEDDSPPLSWSGVPEGTSELALICDDPDAPTPEPWGHWIITRSRPPRSWSAPSTHLRCFAFCDGCGSRPSSSFPWLTFCEPSRRSVYM